MLELILIQSVWHSDNVAERIFQKKIDFETKSADYKEAW